MHFFVFPPIAQIALIRIDSDQAVFDKPGQRLRALAIVLMYFVQTRSKLKVVVKNFVLGR